MPIHELTICCTSYHLQQTSATPQRAPEFNSVQCISIKILLCEENILKACEDLSL